MKEDLSGKMAHNLANIREYSLWGDVETMLGTVTTMLGCGGGGSVRRGLVSVETPAYNCEAYIGEAIESVRAQTYADWEMVVVDDCSTDGTAGAVRAYSESDPRVRYVHLPENSGAAAARTLAMRLAEGEYIAFLDSDDLWLPEKLERQLAFMCEGATPSPAPPTSRSTSPAPRSAGSSARPPGRATTACCSTARWATRRSCTASSRWASSRSPTSASATTTPCG